MKIYQVNCTLSGSTGTICRQIHARLLSLGYESRIAYGHGKGKADGAWKMGSRLGQMIHHQASKYTGLIGWFSVIGTLRLIRDIRRENPDIIHLHNLHDNYVNVPILLRFLGKRNKPVVFTLHDCWPFTGKCPHYTAAGCMKWKTECRNCCQLRRFPESRFIDTSKLLFRQKRRLYQNIKELYVTAVSKWLSCEASESMLRSRPMAVIPNGVDISVFKKEDTGEKRKRMGLDEKKIVLGVAGGGSLYKGLGMWGEIRGLLGDEYALVLVGLRKEQIGRLPEGIIGIQKTDDTRELVEYYNMADVYASMSIEETFGLATAEAMACGTPAAVFNSTANSELVCDGCGFVAGEYTAEAMAEGIRTIINRGKEAYSDLCRERIIANYSVQAMSDKYISLYEGILGNHAI